MNTILEVKEILEKDKDLNSNLDLLTEISLSEKSLLFSPNIKGINFEKLKDLQIIKLDSDKYHILNFKFIGFKIYSLFKKNCKEELSDDFKSFVLLLKEIETAYKTENYVQDISSLFNELWEIAILDSNHMFNSDFSAYIKSLDITKNRSEVFSFNEAYSRALPYLNIEISNFYSNGLQLINWTKCDAEYNMPLGILLKGIRDKIFKNDEWSLKCFEYTINQTNIETNLLTPIITGLYDKQGITFFNNYLDNNINNEKYAVSIICGLSNIELVKNSDCEIFFRIYNQSNKNDNQVLLNLPKLLFSIIRSKNSTIYKKYIKQAFKYLNKLLDIDNQNLIYFILRENDYQLNHLELRQDLIIQTIKKQHFKLEYLTSINRFLWCLKDIVYFEKILYTIGDYLPFKSIANILSSPINELRSNFKKEFDKMIIFFLIQDNANYRFLGTDIFNSFSQRSFTFAYDILELSSLNQYKLWVSILQSYREPKNTIPCLLPLLKSKSRIVQESFISKLEEYTENYGGLVTKILEEQLDLSDIELKGVFQRVEKYRDDFFQNYVLVKEGIKELNPIYSQNKLFLEFNKSYNRHFSRQFQKSSEENSLFLNLCSKVTLLKGGGWKMEGQKEISKLGSISSSFSLPRVYFSKPEYFDYEFSVEMITNWNDDDFAEIKPFLENE